METLNAQLAAIEAGLDEGLSKIDEGHQEIVAELQKLRDQLGTQIPDDAKETLGRLTAKVQELREKSKAIADIIPNAEPEPAPQPAPAPPPQPEA